MNLKKQKHLVGAQLYLIFQPIYKTITAFSGLPDTISEWEFKGLPNEKIMLLYTTSKSLSKKLEQYNSRVKLKFKGSCLKQEDKAAFAPTNLVNFFIVSELNARPRDLDSDFALGVCLF